MLLNKKSLYCLYSLALLSSTTQAHLSPLQLTEAITSLSYPIASAAEIKFQNASQNTQIKTKIVTELMRLIQTSVALYNHQNDGIKTAKYFGLWTLIHANDLINNIHDLTIQKNDPSAPAPERLETLTKIKTGLFLPFLSYKMATSKSPLYASIWSLIKSLERTCTSRKGDKYEMLWPCISVINALFLVSELFPTQ